MINSYRHKLTDLVFNDDMMRQQLTCLQTEAYLCQVFIISADLIRVNIISPSPIVLGSNMQVKCAASTVGGIGVFYNQYYIRDLMQIRLKVTHNNKKDVLAAYDPMIEHVIPDFVKVSNLM